MLQNIVACQQGQPLANWSYLYIYIVYKLSIYIYIKLHPNQWPKTIKMYFIEIGSETNTSLCGHVYRRVDWKDIHFVIEKRGMWEGFQTCTQIKIWCVQYYLFIKWVAFVN